MNIPAMLKNTFAKCKCRNGLLDNLRTLFNRQPIQQHTRKYHQHGRSKQIQPTQTLFDVNNLSIKKYPISYDRALKIKLKIAQLNYMYDPAFNIELFKQGANQAFSVVTKNIYEKVETEQCLSSRPASEQTDNTKIHIALEPNQFLQTIVLDINSINHFEIFGQIQYSIDVLGVGYKPDIHSNDYIIETFLHSRFERYYGNNPEKPNWKMVRFDIILMNRINLPI